MRIAVVHGYYLGDSGSGVYTRYLASQLRADGHDVTLVCQERHPDRYDFIDSVWTLDSTNTVLEPVGEQRDPGEPGSCRLVRPDLGGRLLVYVDGPFDGFSSPGVRPLQDAPTEWIDASVSANVSALRTVFDEWPPDLVLAQHAIMQPYTVRQALGGRCPYLVTSHGSELNFSLKVDPRLTRFCLDGLRDARAVVAVSPASAEDLVGWVASQGLDIADKTSAIPPGIDTGLFRPAPSRRLAISDLETHVAPARTLALSTDDDILAFVGRVGWNKGIQHVVVGVSLASVRRPGMKLLVAGAGPAQGALSRLAALLSAGDLAGARELAISDPELRTAPEFGPLIPDDAHESGQVRIAFLGHLPSTDVARVFAAADIALAPSTFPEAAALVTSEGLSSGALPIVAYQTGLRMLADVECDALGDPAFCTLVPGRNLSRGIAEELARALDRYATADTAFRQRLHSIAVDHFPSWLDVARHHVELGTQNRE